MTQLLAQFSTQKLVGFILVLARVTPLFMFAPLFSSKSIPRRVRTVVALGISVGLAPIALQGKHLSTDPVAIAGMVGTALLVGFAFAFMVAVLFAAVQTAGTLLDTSAGFTFGAEIDPITGNNAAVLAQLYGIFGTMIFIVIGGDAWLLRGLSKTFDLVPVNGSAHLTPLVAAAENAFSSMFTSAIEVAAPVAAALIITDISFGMVSRVVPQLNVFAVGFPMKVGVALLTVGATLPFVAGWISQQLGASVAAALGAMGAA